MSRFIAIQILVLFFLNTPSSTYLENQGYPVNFTLKGSDLKVHFKDRYFKLFLQKDYNFLRLLKPTNRFYSKYEVFRGSEVDSRLYPTSGSNLSHYALIKHEDSFMGNIYTWGETIYLTFDHETSKTLAYIEKSWKVPESRYKMIEASKDIYSDKSTSKQFFGVPIDILIDELWITSDTDFLYYRIGNELANYYQLDSYMRSLVHISIYRPFRYYAGITLRHIELNKDFKKCHNETTNSDIYDCFSHYYGSDETCLVFILSMFHSTIKSSYDEQVALTSNKINLTMCAKRDSDNEILNVVILKPSKNGRPFNNHQIQHNILHEFCHTVNVSHSLESSHFMNAHAFYNETYELNDTTRQKMFIAITLNKDRLKDQKYPDHALTPLDVVHLVFAIGTFIMLRLLFIIGILPILISASNELATTENEKGGSSISGMLVTCHTSLENCLEACYMSCYITDLCNDQPDLAACAPGLTQMVILTLVFVILVTTCCGVLCFFAPCCCCAIIYKGYRARQAGRRNRADRQNPTTYASAPPLLAKV